MRIPPINKSTAAIAVVFMLFGSAMVATSGELHPPDGPVRPTGASLNDIFQSVNREAPSPTAVDPGMAAFPSGVGFMFMHTDNGEIPREGVFNAPTAVFGFSHDIRAPRDAASGLPTGRRQHKPITVTKPVDKSTPLLMNALVNGEVIDEVVIEMGSFPRGVDFPGEPVTYTLIDAQIVSVSPFTRGMAPDAVVFMEQVEIVYRTIVVSSLDGGITAQDDWETPQVD